MANQVKLFGTKVFTYCILCGNKDSECTCPVCPKCNSQGDVLCYEHYNHKGHGLKMSESQEEFYLHLDLEQF